MKIIKFTILAFLLGCSAYLLNAQITVNTDDVIHMGNISETLETNTDFQLDLRFEKKAFIKGYVRNSSFVVVGQPPYPPVSVGFQFVPKIDIITIGPLIRKSVMALTGLSDGMASIGSNTNNMLVVYSKYYYSAGNYIGTLANSDFNLKTNIRELMPMSENILKLRPVIYDFVKTSSGEDVSDDSAYKNRTGFIAQEVGKIFPDLVAIDENNIYSLDYAGLIPYLTKALQEQSELNKEQEKTIANLQQQINNLLQGFNTAELIIDETEPNRAPKTPEISQTTDIGNVLHQNAPNPFNISTTIKYQLSDNATVAKICIYNLTGKQLQCYNLPAVKGEGSIEVRASSLQAGMYLYSLIVDDKLISTKRMVLTE